MDPTTHIRAWRLRLFHYPMTVFHAVYLPWCWLGPTNCFLFCVQNVMGSDEPQHSVLYYNIKFGFM